MFGYHDFSSCGKKIMDSYLPYFSTEVSLVNRWIQEKTFTQAKIKRNKNEVQVFPDAKGIDTTVQDLSRLYLFSLLQEEQANNVNVL